MFELSPSEVAVISVATFEAMQKPQEFAALLGAVNELQPKTILEIGIGRGGASWAFSKISSVENHILIDLPGGPWGGADTEKTQATLNYINSHSRSTLTYIAGNSQNSECVDKLKEVLQGKYIDFLFIDGAHNYYGVKSDYLTYSPFVRSGGLIGFHDVCEHAPETGCEVKKFWDEVKASGIPNDQYSEFIAEPANWGGIALVRW